MGEKVLFVMVLTMFLIADSIKVRCCIIRRLGKRIAKEGHPFTTLAIRPRSALSVLITNSDRDCGSISAVQL